MIYLISFWLVGLMFAFGAGIDDGLKNKPKDAGLFETAIVFTLFAAGLLLVWPVYLGMKWSEK